MVSSKAGRQVPAPAWGQPYGFHCPGEGARQEPRNVGAPVLTPWEERLSSPRPRAGGWRPARQTGMLGPLLWPQELNARPLGLTSIAFPGRAREKGQGWCVPGQEGRSSDPRGRAGKRSPDPRDPAQGRDDDGDAAWSGRRGSWGREEGGAAEGRPGVPAPSPPVIPAPTPVSACAGGHADAVLPPGRPPDGRPGPGTSLRLRGTNST